jgi:hypothetical protein
MRDSPVAPTLTLQATPTHGNICTERTMPRKTANAAADAPSRSSSKRAAPPDPPSRQSKRAKAAKKYAEPASNEDEEDAVSPASANQDDAKESEYDAESGNDARSEPDSDHEEASSEDDSKPAKRTPRGRPAARTVLPLHKKQRNEDEPWKDGAKLAPGTQVIIKRPKAREAGNVPYADDTIHPNTMLFLKDLAVHNDRQWLKAHDPDYRSSLQDFTTFLDSLTEKVIEADDTIPELPVKDIVSTRPTRMFPVLTV